MIQSRVLVVAGEPDAEAPPHPAALDVRARQPAARRRASGYRRPLPRSVTPL